MNPEELGDQLIQRLSNLLAAVRTRNLRPAAIHLGQTQFAAIAAAAKRDMGVDRIACLSVFGLPVWRDEREHHLEIEVLGERDTSWLEASLRA